MRIQHETGSRDLIGMKMVLIKVRPLRQSIVAATILAFLLLGAGIMLWLDLRLPLAFRVVFASAYLLVCVAWIVHVVRSFVIAVQINENAVTLSMLTRAIMIRSQDVERVEVRDRKFMGRPYRDILVYTNTAARPFRFDGRLYDCDPAAFGNLLEQALRR